MKKTITALVLSLLIGSTLVFGNGPTSIQVTPPAPRFYRYRASGGACPATIGGRGKDGRQKHARFVQRRTKALYERCRLRFPAGERSLLPDEPEAGRRNISDDKEREQCQGISLCSQTGPAKRNMEWQDVYVCRCVKDFRYYKDRECREKGTFLQSMRDKKELCLYRQRDRGLAASQSLFIAAGKR